MKHKASKQNHVLIDLDELVKEKADAVQIDVREDENDRKLPP